LTKDEQTIEALEIEDFDFEKEKGKLYEDEFEETTGGKILEGWGDWAGEGVAVSKAKIERGKRR
jgi:U3 small nucleolar RNA-associated protein 14